MDDALVQNRQSKIHNPESLAGRHLHLTGIVQGVGFRPFVYALAARYQLGGWVLNDSAGVEIEIFGPVGALDAFSSALARELPPLAVIDDLASAPISPPFAEPLSLLSAERSPLFRIRSSVAQPGAFVPVSPDIAICPDCLAELFDAGNRRYRYPFINCTNCGPRFSIIRDLPYDRPLTTMASFAMCPDCRREYEDPSDRRFHAQPNACPVCGPQLTFVWSPAHTTCAADPPLHREDALQAARRLLSGGGILAVKGIGGFHLACRADLDEPLAELRRRKGRIDKPFAVMALDLPAVERVAVVSPAARTLLTSRARPIVLLPAQLDSTLSALVAPGSRTVGVMLPYTPLHYLLLTSSSTSEQSGDSRSATLHPSSFILHPFLVMTSGNLSEEPIVHDNAAAFNRLAPLADAFLLHDRDIHVPIDDSVVRVFEERALPIRRARGYAPFPVRLAAPLRPLAAVGGELKSAFCLTRERYAFLSQHIGDMENLATFEAFTHLFDHYRRLFHVDPQAIAHDLHPGYLSTRWAIEYAAATGVPLVAVQHHHAHIAALLAEHAFPPAEAVIGLSFDGTGYGPDGTIWGGEVLVATCRTFTRVGRLRPVPLPGGDRAIRYPYRAALAWLWAAGIPWEDDLPPVAAASLVERGVILRQLETGLNSVLTSSFGRLFDAVAALAGLRQTITYEAQGALELEALTFSDTADAYPFPLDFRDDSKIQSIPSGLHSADPALQFEMDHAALVRAIVTDLRRQTPMPVIAARFHNAVAAVAVACCEQVRTSHSLTTVALSGGVFQNAALLDRIAARLRAAGFHLLTHHQVPPNDGGLALGQAIIAHHQLEAGGPP